MPRAKQRTPELRATLLGVAMSVLAEDGVEGLTTRRVAEHAGTSTPALYELFGDRAGLVREMFYEGFRLLQARFETFVDTNDPTADLLAVVAAFREFANDNPALVQLMFSRPFADFDPGPEEVEAGQSTRSFVVRQVKRCIAAGDIAGDPTDVAHVLLAMCQGMAVQESAGWLGTSQRSRDRRWRLATQALIKGLAP